MPVPVISVAQMREWEKATWAGGGTESAVIARVGELVARRAREMLRGDGPILVLAGKGHNGDDTRKAYEHLRDPRVVLQDINDPTSSLADVSVILQQRPALIIDGLFGIGLNRPLHKEWAELIQRINDAHASVLSVDVPSGLNAESGWPEGASIRASVTLTLGAPKHGLLLPPAWPYVGRLEVAPDIGLVNCPFHGETNWILPADFEGYPPARMSTGHKGDFGRLAIIAGSMGYHGAAVLTARGAQRAQPGLITLYAEEAVYQPVASQLQAVMVHPWHSKPELAADTNGILIGPGLAAKDLPSALKTAARKLWQQSAAAMVVDASALDWLPQETPVLENAIRVVTPHPGEAARLLGISTAEVQADRPKALREISRRLGNCWVVLKGQQSLIGRSSGELLVNSSGNPHLAQGGSGDVLAGFLAGLLAQRALQFDPLKTISYGVWQHGATADWLAQTSENWVIEDLAKEIGNRGADFSENS